MKQLLGNILQCKLCEKELPHGVRPVVSAARDSRILIIGQAPGRKVHETGIPWNDRSGDQLRNWLGVDKDLFYDPHLFALLPMGFCYPGKGRSGDLPPLPRCAPHWHPWLLTKFESVQLIILVGSYAQKYYLGKDCKKTLTETVRAFPEYLPDYFPLVHPSPRNGIWQRKNPWFSTEVIPVLQKTVLRILKQ